MANDSSEALPALNVVPSVTATAVRYTNSAVASFRRLSPSRMTMTRWGIRRRRITAEAATASGGATIAPMAMAADQGMSGIIQCTVHATATMVRPTAMNTSDITGIQ